MICSHTFKGSLVVLAGVLIHLSFGSIYTIGNMMPYISSYIIKNLNKEFNKGSVVFVSGVTLAGQGFFMPLGGLLAPKIGVKQVIILACLINSGLYMITYWAIQKNFIYILVTYALSQGLGIGLGYSVVIQAAISWFPNRSGAISGIICAGFGLGALVFTPIQKAFINPDNIKPDNITNNFNEDELLQRVPMSYILVGGVMFCLQAVGCIFIRSNRKSTTKSAVSVPEHFIGDQVTEEELKKNQKNEKVETKQILDMSPKMALKCYYFYLLWFTMFCNIIPITLITSAYKLMGQNSIRDDNYLSIIATLSSLFNCLGRLFWGFIVDKASFKFPILCMLIMWSISLFIFPNIFLVDVGLRYAYGILVAILFFSMSGVFAMMPVATRTLFGHKFMATNYGIIFSAFAFGGILTATASYFANENWDPLFYGAGAICILAATFVTFIHDPNVTGRLKFCNILSKKDRRKYNQDI